MQHRIKRHMWMAATCTVLLAAGGKAEDQPGGPANIPAPADPAEWPVNGPAIKEWNETTGQLRLSYNGQIIFDAKVTAPAGVKPSLTEKLVYQNDRDNAQGGLTQVITLSATTGELQLLGMVTASDEAFAGETKGEAQQRFPLVRTSVGQSRNLRNNSIYDRHLDWALSGPSAGQTRIVPGKPAAKGTTFELRCRGNELALTFQPRLYQKHKGVKHFTPWTKKMRRDSITGWCSWWAYGGGFNQQQAASLLDAWRTQHMADYGYRFIQIDDCFEIAQGAPDKWLNWNNKFPAGMQGYADSVRAAGFTPGVWITSVYKDAPVLPEQNGWFVRGADGAPHRTPDWKDYCIDATIPAAADTLIRPIYKGVRAAGYGYVKIDGLRHRLYDSIDHCLPDMAARGITRDECFRSYLKAARAELGEDTFVLACWGVIPEVAGLADACRLGGDGFNPATLQSYNSWNNVIWRNDPDHCDILPARKAVDSGDVLKTESTSGLLEDTVIRPTVVSMAGAMLMLSDKAEVYRDSKAIEGARRASPVLFSVPGQLYDYGGGPVCPWWLMEVDRPFEHWTVLSHLNFGEQALPASTVRFRDLGLDDDQLVWEFWTRKLVAVNQGGFEAEALGARGTRTYAIRPRLDHPQLLSTSRHISQGGVDLIDVQWTARNQLAGRSRVVVDDPYQLVLHVSVGFEPHAAIVNGKPAAIAREGEIARVSFVPAKTGEIDWRIDFVEK